MNRTELEHILKQLHRDAYIWARQCCQFDDELAKDMLQQSYLKILEGKAKLKDPKKAKTWLFSIIRYTIIDEYRKAGKVVPLEESYDPIDTIEEVDSTDYEGIIKKLPEMQREVIMAVFYHQMTIAESAEILQINVGTARTHYERGKKKLKELIQKSQLIEQNGK
ncbi:RNA polymerase sigma factor [Algoriphagus zhangzhouensis]|uniref:RNA polymerase sigma-70 factor, ECF subfamily n=1 Tax=Algoriphagus zhangzhouensis TaxID=1073327 RepID=A0A1M7ZFX3_9BACT|nr:RNA polymerase sigma factor [Algoriphagus zhangzhouensis]TDY44936.1 RNA polymerase sigma-70 factor (ECF subfamily) [Algoriphagus zhangzhouensis]SHO63773.1 RNA polymerase sigma-70 factor, ECF subfamily [Algoriphagus zhangzhouensis]